MTITKRDPETGRIVGKKLSSEEAAKLARRRWEKPRQDTLESLLIEAGYQSVEEAPTIVRLMARQVAEGGARSVQAAREFLRMIRVKPEGEERHNWGNVPLCPYCKSQPIIIVLSRELARQYLDRHNQTEA
jgi:hypothetical protein